MGGNRWLREGTARYSRAVHQGRRSQVLAAKTLTVTAYDNGIKVDSRPVSSDPLDQAYSWLQAHEVIGIALTEFYRQTAKRQKEYRLEGAKCP
jgi:hypothetical protein